MTAAPAPASGADRDPPAVDLWPSRDAVVGETHVRRALPQRGRRTVGAWCFIDHMGPLPTDATPGGIGPHPHAGLHTVTWLVEGELLHRDSLGSEQAIRPGQLNLMTAGHGVSHAEEPTGRRGGGLHGVQLWVAQPETTRHGAPAFEHHPDLPEVELGSAVATVLAGEVAGAVSPARRDTDLVGLDLRFRSGATEVPLVPSFEHALVVIEGAVRCEGRTVVPGQLAYLGPGRDELVLSASAEARLLLVGGEPFESPLAMWWNFVGRSRDELAEAGAQWNAGSQRFGDTGSLMGRIPAPPAPWTSPSP
jgi:quercetin 2,3-dioxygenase